MKPYTRHELLHILHYRTQKLCQIRQDYEVRRGDDAAIIERMNNLAGDALCLGPDASTLCIMASEKDETALVQAQQNDQLTTLTKALEKIASARPCEVEQQDAAMRVERFNAFLASDTVDVARAALAKDVPLEKQNKNAVAP